MLHLHWVPFPRLTLAGDDDRVRGPGMGKLKLRANYAKVPLWEKVPEGRMRGRADRRI